MTTYQNQEHKLINKTSDNYSHFHISRNTYSGKDKYYTHDEEYYGKKQRNEYIPGDVIDRKINYQKERIVQKKEIIPVYAKMEISFILIVSLVFAIFSILLLILMPTNSFSVLLLLASIGFISLLFPLLYLSKKIS